jgi:hypothetical protein
VNKGVIIDQNRHFIKGGPLQELGQGG